MFQRGSAGLLALAAVAFAAPWAWAQEGAGSGFRGEAAPEAATLLLDLRADPAQPSQILDDDPGDADTYAVHWRGHRGFSFGFSFGHRHHYHYRPYYHSFHRPYYYPRFYGHHYHRPFYHSHAFRSFYSSYYPGYSYSYYPRYSYSYYSYSPFYCTIGDTVASAPVCNLSCVPGMTPVPEQEDSPSRKPAEGSSPPAMPRADEPPGTYPYDGGPAAPVPMPSGTRTPARPTVPLEGQAVSLPGPAPRLAYPAYGESLGEVTDRDDVLLIRR